jgi:hypothetical protein
MTQPQFQNPHQLMEAIIGHLSGTTIPFLQRTQHRLMSMPQVNVRSSNSPYNRSIRCGIAESCCGRNTLRRNCYSFSHRLPVRHLEPWISYLKLTKHVRSVIIDYIPTKRLPKTRKFMWWVLRAATLSVAVGLYEFETNDVGVTEAIKRIWKA